MASLAIIVNIMFRSGDNASFLESLGVSDSHQGIHKDILTITLLAPAPSLVTGDVDNRSIDLTDTDCPEFLRDNLTDFEIEIIVESRRHSDALRETCSVAPLGTVQGLSVLKNGNSPAAGLDGLAGVFVDSFSDYLGVIGKTAVWKEMADIADMTFRLIPFLVIFIHEQQLGADLRDLFLDAHPGEEVLNPFFDRKVLVTELEVALKSNRTCLKIK